MVHCSELHAVTILLKGDRQLCLLLKSYAAMLEYGTGTLPVRTPKIGQGHKQQHISAVIFSF